MGYDGQYTVPPMFDKPFTSIKADSHIACRAHAMPCC